MATNKVPKSPLKNWEQVRDHWVDRLRELMGQLDEWAKELDWATRRLDKRITDSQIGEYQAPMLLMQQGAARILAEPIARFVPGADGVVDLYLMPAYDDIASLYYQEGEWKLHYAFPGDLAVAHPKEGEAHPLTKEVFGAAVGEMAKHAA